MKKGYLKELEQLLNQYDIEDIEKTDIVDEYSDMYDGWLDSGMNEEEVEYKLGEPSIVVRELMEDNDFKRVIVEKSNDYKIVALMPFISLIIFFIAGFGYEQWKYAWIAFLLIPMVAILQDVVKKKNTNSIIGLVPFLCLITYLILGFGFDLWHPGWVVWLLVPVSGILIGNRRGSVLSNATALAPFIALLGFFVIGENGYYHPGWLIFFLIPIAGALNEKNSLKKLVYEICLIGGVIAYLYLYTLEYAWDYSLIAFIPLGIIALYHLFIEFKDVALGYKVCILGSVVLYIFLGIEYSLWGYAWLLFLSIPVYAIISEVDNDDKYMALMPFIAITIFFTLGWFFDLWAFSWMAFLIIPIFAIIKES